MKKNLEGFTPLEIFKKIFFIAYRSRRRIRFGADLNRKHKAESLTGFTLLETLVALFVLSFAFTGPLTLAWFSIRSADFSQNQFIASYLAEEALEFVKNVRDNNALQENSWLQGLAPAGAGNGICRNDKGCTIDVSNNNIQSCPGSGDCPKLRYNSANGLYNYSSGAETLFVRKIQLSRISSYEERVAVIISWQERSVNKSFIIEENIFDWP